MTERIVSPRRQILDRDRRTPLWEQLRADLTLRLDAGEFADSFPGELAITQDYGVSRHTVREALRRMREAGLVTAVRGKTPRVATDIDLEQPIGALYSIFAAVEAAGLRQVSVVRCLDLRTDGVAAGRLGLDEATPLLYLERQRLAGGEPLALDRVWLPADRARPLLRADFTRTALYDELARRCSIRLTGGREQLRAVVPGAGERRLLGIGPGTAAFAIDRLGGVDGVAFEWRQSLVRGDRFSVSAQISARDGYRSNLAAERSAASG